MGSKGRRKFIQRSNILGVLSKWLVLSCLTWNADGTGMVLHPRACSALDQAQSGESAQLTASSLGGRENRVCVWCFSFLEGCPKDWSLSWLTWGTDGRCNLDAWGQWEQKRVGWLPAAAPKNLQYCRHTREETRDYELLEKKKLQTSLIGKLYTQAQASHPLTPKRFQRPPESNQTDWWRSSPLQGSPSKFMRRLIFWMHKIQKKQKSRRHKKKQKHGPIKGKKLISTNQL